MNLSIVLPLVLLAVQQLVPLVIGDATKSAAVVKMLSGLLPMILQEASDLVPIFRSVIATLRGGDTTPEAAAELDAMEAKIDADFDAAVAAKLGA